MEDGYTEYGYRGLEEIKRLKIRYTLIRRGRGRGK